VYTADPPLSFYASYISGALRLPDGNTLICDGVAGRFFEVTPEKVTVWQYTNPYPAFSMNNVFKVCYIPPKEPEPMIPDVDCSGSFSWTRVQPGQTVTGSFQIQNRGAPGSLLDWVVNVSSLEWGTWSFTPSSGKSLTPEDGEITIEVSVVAPAQTRTKFEGYIRVENQQNSSDFDIVPVVLRTSFGLGQNLPLFSFLQNHFLISRMIRIVSLLLSS
jgi:hypothetical protein